MHILVKIREVATQAAAGLLCGSTLSSVGPGCGGPTPAPLPAGAALPGPSLRTGAGDRTADWGRCKASTQELVPVEWDGAQPCYCLKQERAALCTCSLAKSELKGLFKLRLKLFKLLILLSF